MLRYAILAISVSLATTGTGQADGRSQLLATVSKELHFFVPGVDPETLSTAQLAQINGVIHRDLSHSSKIGAIKSILGGQHSLRGLLFGSGGVVTR